MNKNLLTIPTVILMVMLVGCTNWEQKYKALDVEHQNLSGLYENCVSSLDGASTEKTQLTRALSQSQQTIEGLQNQIEQGPTDQATGFTGMDVEFDASRGTITVTLPNAILFSPGKASLRGTTSAELDHVLSVIKERYAGKQIDVVGHTDSDPIKKSAKYWKDNWELSAERSLTVLRYMSSRGISAEKIRAVACGQSRPVASNSNSSGKARNRRVEIVVNMR